MNELSQSSNDGQSSNGGQPSSDGHRPSVDALSTLVFFGTPTFAVPCLDALVAAGRAPALVVSQPSRPVGRGRSVQPPPVAQRAAELGLPVVQPASVKDKDFLASLEALAPDLAVVVAFGQIFRRRLLGLPRRGCVNVHASLLPRWRGAAPIQAAIAAGDEVTGVCTMVMEAGMDTGPELLRRTTPIGPRETHPELAQRLSVLGGEVLVETLEALERGEVEPKAQDDAAATYAPRIEKSDGVMDWRLGARQLDSLLRAYTPWPGLTATLRDRPLKVLQAQPVEWGGGRADAGTVLGVVKHEGVGRLAVAAGEGPALGLERVQRPGKKAVSAVDWVNGERVEAGERFALLPPATAAD